MENRIRKGANSSYFGDILESIKTLSGGLWLTLKHIFQATKRRNSAYISDKNYFDQKTGLVTLQYPYESLPVPDNGRYRLHNEIDDCIVCDKCAKVCPVDCITIESIKATEEIGKTSDGTPKRLYAPTFDIDLAKCCYCGLCTTVCPTESLTMTKVYDFSEQDVDNFIYKFADMTWEEAEKRRKEIEAKNAEKEAAKAAAKSTIIEASKEGETAEAKSTVGKPVFKPKIRTVSPSGLSTNSAEESKFSAKGIENKEEADQTRPAAKPVFKPKIKPLDTGIQDKPSGEEKNAAENKVETNQTSKIVPRPAFKPKIKSNVPTENIEQPANLEQKIIDEMNLSNEEPLKEQKQITSKPVFRPKIRPLKTDDGKKEE